LSSREVHKAWNANSLNQRFDSGDLINLLMAHNPTTTSISEINTSLIDFRDPEGLRHILKTLGYGFCAFNWCTQTQQNGTKGSGNFGIAVISKVPLTNLRFGVNHERLDREGRAITATIGERTKVWVCVPCSRFEPDAERSLLRKEWNEALSTHCKTIKELEGASPFIMGDLNVAPTVLDCTRSVSIDPTFPSTTPSVSEAFSELLSSMDSVDAYVTLQPGCRAAHAKGKVYVSHFSWWRDGQGITRAVEVSGLVLKFRAWDFCFERDRSDLLWSIPVDIRSVVLLAKSEVPWGLQNLRCRG
jgi:exonuclease III